MRKFSILTFFLALCVCNVATAQPDVLRKLIGKSSGESVNLYAYGDNPGINISLKRCVNEGEYIVLYYDLVNQTDFNFEPVLMQNYGNIAATAQDAMGRNYGNIVMVMDGVQRDKDISARINARTTIPCEIGIPNVSAETTHIAKVTLIFDARKDTPFNPSGGNVEEPPHYFSFVVENLPVIQPVVAVAPTSSEYAIVNASNVNVRTAPSTTARKVTGYEDTPCQLQKGEVVKVLQSRGGWLKVSFNDYEKQEGWIIENSLSVVAMR